MNPETGQIYEAVADIELAKDRGEPLVRIPNRDLEKVKVMSVDDRKAYANRIIKRRKQAKARRKADRKRRGRR
jgi:hypothetical protein